MNRSINPSLVRWPLACYPDLLVHDSPLTGRHSSVGEHSTADREVTGSNPVAPCRPWKDSAFPAHCIQGDGASGKRRQLWLSSKCKIKDSFNHSFKISFHSAHHNLMMCPCLNLAVDIRLQKTLGRAWHGVTVKQRHWLATSAKNRHECHVNLLLTANVKFATLCV